MKKILTLSGIGLILFCIMLYAGIKIISTSWFCLQCHESSNAAANWKKSKHGPSNPEINNCIHCHSRPGFIGYSQSLVDKFFSHIPAFDSIDFLLTAADHDLKPSKSVTCIRSDCHQMEFLDRSVRKHPTVALNHAVHVKIMEEVGTRSKCMPCHVDIAHGQSTYLPDMKSTCFLCHAERDIQSSQCDLCHQGHPEVRLKGKKVSLFGLHEKTKISCLECHVDHCKATKANCEKCHKGKGYGDLILF